jgi:hypothetical protein
MRNLLCNRRGSVAFATVVALVPVIAVVALGGEAGTWYVTKQQAQTAADAAAYSGALKLACDLAPSSCTDTSSVDYRGKQFAAQNAFCNAGDTSYPGSRCVSSLPSGISHTVDIASLTSWNGAGGNFVQATVSQQQPAYLAALLGLTTVDIGATAVARVITLANPCVLSLRDPISFQGSPTVQAPNCGLASNNTDSDSINFTGGAGINVSNVGSISGQGGCTQTGGTQCNNVVTYAPPVADPMAPLQTAMASVTTASFTGACGTTANPPTPYDATDTTRRCYNQAGNGGSNFKFENGKTYTLNGVYFFNGSLTVNGNAIITGTATLIFLPGATLTINGNPLIQLTALSTVTAAQVPTALQGTSTLTQMSGLLIYYPTAGDLILSGNSTSYFSGITYAPNANVTYQGSTTSNTCVQIIAAGVKLSGNSTFDNSGCPASSKVESHYVRMVQ